MAELLGHFIKGQRLIRVSDKKVFLMVKPVVDWFSQVAQLSKDAVFCESKYTSLMRSRPTAVHNRIHDARAFAQNYIDVIPISDADLQKLIEDFRALWSYRTYRRDVACIPDPDDHSRLIMFVGDIAESSRMSYKLVEKAAKLGIIDAFGLAGPVIYLPVKFRA